MRKRVLAMIMAVILVISCLPVGVVAEGDAHIHCLCGKETTLNATCEGCGEKAVEWIAVETLPTAEGFYYLTKNISAEGVEYANGMQTAICLCGHDITSANGGQILSTNSGARLTLTDCAQAQGKLTGASTNAYGSAVRVKKGSTFVMYGGQITGNTAPATGDGTVYVDKGDNTTPGGTFYMYGGEISGNSARRGSGIFTASVKSPALPASVHILGGTITGNTGTGTGGTKGGAGILAFGPVEIGGNARVTGNNAKEGVNDIYLRNTSGYLGQLVLSADMPLTGGASVSFGADSGDLSGLTGTPTDWSCGWVDYEGETVSYVGGQFILGHYHGDREYTPISDNVALSKAEGYGYLTCDLNLGGEQTRNKNLHLCLNGHTIKAKAGKRIFTSSDKTPVTVVIEDCTAYTDEDGVYHAGQLTGGQNSQTGGGAIYLAAGNTLTLVDGKITGNTSTVIGGAILAYGTVNIQGGEISGNTAIDAEGAYKNGGAIAMNKGSQLNMTGGVIRDNLSRNGGAIYVGMSTVNIAGGTITGNEAKEKGGAIYSTGTGSITLAGGKITQNTAADLGGGCFWTATEEDARLTVSGNAVIADNSVDSQANNLYLAGNSLLTVGELRSGAKIGISADAGNRAISNACTDYSGFFTGDDEAYKVTYQAGALFLGTPITHIHCICGGISCSDHESAGFAAWNKTDSLPSAGAYYLTENVVLTDVAAITDLRLCLNGHTVTQSAAKRMFELATGGKLTITDCAAAYTDGAYTGGQLVGGVSDTGAAILIREGATFNLYGGRITGSKPASADKATSGSAIFLRSSTGAGATFNMYGGELTGNGNELSWGGAISNGSGNRDNAVSVNIYGGKIFGNTAATGGAIRLENKSILTVYGGQITGNTATNAGGAIYLSKGAALDLQGGTVTGNTASVGGGIFTNTSGAEVSVSGNPTVIDNTVSGKQNNLYLNADLVINLGDVADAAKVGVTAVKSDCFLSGTSAKDVSANFPSDSAYKVITYRDNALYISASTDHQHCICDSTVTGCDHEKQVWTAWESTTTLPTTSGYYYLVDHVQLTALNKMETDQKIYLCLNGKTVTAAENTGHMLLAKGTVLSITDCSQNPGGFTGGSKAYGGVVNVVAGSTLNLFAGELYGNTAPSSEGGAIYLQGGNPTTPGGILNMYGGKIHDNTAGIGGAIRAAGLGTNGGEVSSQINIYGGEIYNNKTFYKLDEEGKKSDVQGEGGAIAATLGTTVNIYGGSIYGNVAEDDGGAIYANEKAKVNIKGGKLYNNESARYGGAVFITAADTALTMEGGEITGNTANAGGAVMLQSNASFVMKGGKISQNTAKSSGGGLYISSKTAFTMEGGEITGNKATGGAGFYALRSQVTLDGGAISNNKAENRGGAFIASGATVVLNKIRMEGNSAKEGGTAYINRSKSTASDGTVSYVPSVATVNEGAVIKGNSAETNCGGLIAANDGVVLTMNGGTITGNTAKNGAGVMTWTGATFVMKGGSISGNSVSINGGGLYISTKSTFIMEGGTISNNTARSGGAIYMLRSQGEFNGGTISYNSVKPKITVKADGTQTTTGGAAGAMYMSGADCNIRGTSFIGNKAETNGGAIVMGRNTYTQNGVKCYDDTSLNISGGLFADNHAVKAAGALLIQSVNTVVNMSGGTFKNNSSDSAAGAIYVSSNTTFNMTGGSIVGNSSLTTGGGIYVLRSKCHITGGELNSNTAAKSGGQMVVSGEESDVLVKNIQFHSGHAKIGAGVVVQTQGNFTAENCEFYDNMADTNSPAVYISTRTGGTLKDCKFYNNKTKGSAGAITVGNFGELTVTGCEFDNNMAATNGGALYVSPVSNVRVENSVFRACTAGERGGAITCKGNLFLVDSLIENCSAQSEGGAVYTDTNTAGGSGVMRGMVVENSEIRNNAAGSIGGAFYVYRGCRLELYDSKLTGNTSPAEGGAIWAYEDLELHNTEITGNTSGGTGYAVYMNDSGYDGHSYYANHNKLSGSTIIRDNQGGDLWMGKDVVFAIAGYGLGENAYINLVMDSGIVTSRILGAYNYEGGDQVYTITYGDRSMTDPELLPAEEGVGPTETPTEPAGEQENGGNTVIYVGIGAFVAVLAAAAAIVVLLQKKKSVKQK